jgi:hypothetical protein
MAAGDGTFMLRDTFSIHEGRQTNWCVSRIFIYLTADAHSVALPQFVAEHGEAGFREAALIWAVDEIELSLKFAGNLAPSAGSSTPVMEKYESRLRSPVHLHSMESP